MQDPKEIIEVICENIGKANYLAILLIVVLAINIVMTIIKVVSDFALKNKEKNNYKANLIVEKALGVQKDVFDELNDLSLFDASQTQQLLSKIQSIKNGIRRNRIYFPKPLIKTIYILLDYFLNVASDYRMKDVAFEDKFLTLYSKQFNE